MPKHAQPPIRGTRSTARSLAGLITARSSPGQALVEFAAVLVPVLLLVVAVIQFGLLFGANVTLTNAVREGARASTIYVYDFSHTRAWNDAQRCGDAAEAAQQAFGFLSRTSPHFTVTLTSGACPTPAGDGQTNGDLIISYCDHVATPESPCPNGGDPTTVCAPDTRQGCLVALTLTYRTDVVVPFIGAILNIDANGRFVQRVTATMVMN